MADPPNTACPDPSPVLVAGTFPLQPAPQKSWHRLALSVFGITIISAMWAWAVYHVYHLPPEKLGAFTSITTNCFYSIAVIVIFMITGRLVWEWSQSSNIAASSAAILTGDTATPVVPVAVVDTTMHPIAQTPPKASAANPLGQ
jgi:hypothetical protein